MAISFNPTNNTSATSWIQFSCQIGYSPTTLIWKGAVGHCLYSFWTTKEGRFGVYSMAARRSSLDKTGQSHTSGFIWHIVHSYVAVSVAIITGRSWGLERFVLIINLIVKSSRERYASRANLRSHWTRKSANCPRCYKSILEQNMNRHLRKCRVGHSVHEQRRSSQRNYD